MFGIVRNVRAALPSGRAAFFAYNEFPRLAGVAQLVEQLIRNQQVEGSSPFAGSIFLNN
jgi:hypothetical protein